MFCFRVALLLEQQLTHVWTGPRSGHMRTSSAPECRTTVHSETVLMGTKKLETPFYLLYAEKNSTNDRKFFFAALSSHSRVYNRKRRSGYKSLADLVLARSAKKLQGTFL